MRLQVKIVLAIILSSLVVGCSTTNAPKTSTPVETRKTKSAKANVELGMAYLERKNLAQSRQKLVLALEQAPSIPETWYSMGYFLESTGQKQEANSYYLKAIELAPTRADAQNNYGTYLCRTGRYQESIGHFLLATNDKRHLSPADAYENAGKCALKIPDQRLAVKYFSEALNYEPKRTKSVLKLAELNYQMGDYDASRKYLGQFLAISSSTAQSNLLARHLASKTGEGRQTRVMVASAEPEEAVEEVTVSQKIEKPLPFVQRHATPVVKIVAHNYVPSPKHVVKVSKQQKLAVETKSKHTGKEHKKMAVAKSSKHAPKPQKKLALKKASKKVASLDRKHKAVKLAKHKPTTDKSSKKVVMKKINVVHRDLTV